MIKREKIFFAFLNLLSFARPKESSKEKGEPLFFASREKVAARPSSMTAPSFVAWSSCGSASLRLIIFFAGAVMIFFGVERGELQIIFNKASRVCLECIGLG